MFLEYYEIPSVYTIILLPRMESMSRSGMPRNTLYAKCQRTLVRPRSKLARSPVASATNGVFPKFEVPKDVNPLLAPYQLGPFDLSHRIVLAPLTRCRALGEEAYNILVYSALPRPNETEIMLLSKMILQRSICYIASTAHTCLIMQGRCRRSMLQNTMLNGPPKVASSYLRPHAYQSQDMGKRVGKSCQPLLFHFLAC